MENIHLYKTDFENFSHSQNLINNKKFKEKLIFQKDIIRVHGLERCEDFESLEETDSHAWTRTRKGSLCDCNLDEKLSQRRGMKSWACSNILFTFSAHVNKLFMFTLRLVARVFPERKVISFHRQYG